VGVVVQSSDFHDAFEGLTGHQPFPWQRRLFDRWLSQGRLPDAVDIPTGLGKTAIMAVWLLARASGATLPRRLVYVVDRRAVVDQATEFAEQLRIRLSKDETLASVRSALGLNREKLPISTLRGQHADNREWMVNPAASSIIVGTVDMVGSRLLFSGYGVSRRMRPFVAGLLGCDTLVMLDEAHLAHPFERLLRAIDKGQRLSLTDGESRVNGAFTGAATGGGLPPPFRTLPLSATPGRTTGEVFRLNDDDRRNKEVRARLDGCKNLTIESLTSDLKGKITFSQQKTHLVNKLTEKAWKLMEDKCSTFENHPGILIYCDLREIAEKVKENLNKKVKKKFRKQAEKDAWHVILFVGGRRVYERQKAARELQEYGLVGDTAASRCKPVFLVATSAGEVGVDLDADHMVCDLVAWERMVQRLGRVNRRGTGTARVVVIDQERLQGKNLDEKAERRKSVRALLDALPRSKSGECQASPGALACLAYNPPDHREKIGKATTPVPLYPALTRPLIDDWAMTSLEDHAGRPEVRPWLRGWDEADEPQTSVIWRRYLPLYFRRTGDEVDAVKATRSRSLHAFFTSAPPQTVEILETETSRVADWLKERTKKCLEIISGTSDAEKDNDGVDDAPGSTHLLVPLTYDSPIAFILDSANRPVKLLTLNEIKDKKPKDLEPILSGKQLVVDARLGGLTDGLLDKKTDEEPLTIENDEWGELHDSSVGGLTIKIEEGVPDNNADHDGWQNVYAAPYKVSAEGEAESSLIIRKRGGEGEGEDARAVARKAQRLDDHQQWAGEEAARIADALGLDEKNKAMLIAAARHHDDGKAAHRWQRAFNAKENGEPYAKTTSSPNQQILNGYRHEFKSTLDAQKRGLDGLNRDDPCFDLALHLIAAHHGHARPAIGIEGCDDLPPSAAETAAYKIAVRFARLQREWGPWGLAWWEALLRAADQAASRRLDKESV